MALSINILIAYILSSVFCVPFAFLIIATMITYFIYVFLLSRMGRKMLKLNISTMVVIKEIYPVRLVLPYFLSLAFIFLSLSSFWFIIPVLLFIILNFKVLQNLKIFATTIILNPKFIDI